MEKWDLFQVGLLVAIGATGVGVFFGTRDPLRSGFVLFVWTLALGFRTLAVTPYLRITPAELVLWATFATGRRPSGPGRPGLPWWLVGMMPFWALAWVPWDANPYPWDIKADEFRSFVLAVPVFLLVPAVVARPGGWRTLVLAVVGMNTWAMFTGVLEYAAPGVTAALPGFSAGADAYFLAGDFARAKFSFYGSPTATFGCVIGLPLVVAAWPWVGSAAGRAALGGAAAVQLAGVYVGGYRSLWLVVAVQIGLLVVVRRQLLLGVALAVGAAVGYGALPAATQDRVTSMARVLEGNPEETDSSGKKRWARAQYAAEMALSYPLGAGWAASGWIHSDFIQVAANQGLVPGLLFLAGYVVTLARLAERVQNRRVPAPLAPLGTPLLLSMVSIGAVLLYEGAQQYSFTLMPVWLLWAMAEVWLLQTAPPAGPDTRPVAVRSAS